MSENTKFRFKNRFNINGQGFCFFFHVRCILIKLHFTGTCNEYGCKNGGDCKEIGFSRFCDCLEGTTGDFCETVPDCQGMNCGMEATCQYDTQWKKAYCQCRDSNLVLDPEDRKCKSK